MEQHVDGPEEGGYDAGGWLEGGGVLIPASTMNPLPQLSPDQVEVYNRLISRFMAARSDRYDPDAEPGTQGT